jgi:hypothetical protein
MADGNFTQSVDVLLQSVVEEGMRRRMRLNQLRYLVAAAGKQYGVFVSGTDRSNGTIVVTYDGGKSIVVIETILYQQTVPLSTW